MGAFSAAVSFGIANGAMSAGQEFFARALSGGVLEMVQGGKFGHGFASAGLTSAFMPQVGGINNDIVRTATGALIGGTISKATGGKFANGAISGAIQGAMTKNATEAQQSRKAPSVVSQSSGMPLNEGQAKAVLKQGLGIFKRMRADGVMDNMANYDEIDAVRRQHPNAFQVKYDGQRTFVTGGGEIYADADVEFYSGIKFHRIDSLDGFMEGLFHEVGHLDPELAAQWRNTLPGHGGRIESRPNLPEQIRIHETINEGVKPLMEIYRAKYRP